MIITNPSRFLPLTTAAERDLFLSLMSSNYNINEDPDVYNVEINLLNNFILIANIDLFNSTA